MARIVIDARESGTSTGRYIDKLIEYLHKLNTGHEFIVLTKAHRTEFLKTIAPSFEIVETAYKEFTFGEQIGFLLQIKKLGPDLVHFGMVQQPVLYGGRAITTMHDLTTIRFRNPSKNQAIFILKQQVYKWVNKKAARKSQALIVPTNFVKNDVVQYCAVPQSKIHVTYEAADKIMDSPKAISSLKGKKFIMYVGRPMPHKNLSRLIDAHQLLMKRTPELLLVLAGKKDVLYKKIEEDVRLREINNVFFTDFVSESELRWLYENTLCYVFPSLSEGFGLPGLEAMIHGAPVASSNYTCLPEVYGDAAIYFNPTDTKAIGESIEKVINDSKLSNKLKSLGIVQAKKYSWEKMAKETLEIYNSALL